MSIRLLSSLLLLLLSGTAVRATSVRAIELDELVGGSYQIFLGRVVAIDQGTVPGFHRPYVQYTFAVSDWVKGGSGQTLQIRQLGRSGVALLPGLPVYKKGQETLLFVHKPSAIGLTSPVGMQQGLYPVEKDSAGERYVRLGPMRPSVERLRSRLSPARSPSKEAPVQDRIPLDDFLSLVRQAR